MDNALTSWHGVESSLRGLVEGTLSPWGAFWLYAAVSAVGWVYFYRKLPETKDKSMEDMQRLFRE